MLLFFRSFNKGKQTFLVFFSFPPVSSVVDILSKFCCKVRLWWKWTSTRVPSPTAVQSVLLHSDVRAMLAQPFTDKLIRNICRSHWRLFCIFVTHSCIYLAASLRYISVYLLLISSDSRKLARSIKTELMKQNLFPCL